jgi:hypothetical protein
MGTVPSADAVTTWRPSWLDTTALTERKKKNSGTLVDTTEPVLSAGMILSWPEKMPTVSPLAASHRRAVPSSEADRRGDEQIH